MTITGRVAHLAYAPFGETYAESGTPDRSFTGQNQDTLSGGTAGLYDFLYREYAQYGRWISPDPAGIASASPAAPQSWNRYAYVLNNPLSARDLLGRECVWDDGSWDSADDAQTGNQGSCENAGGTWIDPAFFKMWGLPDWSDQPNGDLQKIAETLQKFNNLPSCLSDPTDPEQAAPVTAVAAALTGMTVGVGGGASAGGGIGGDQWVVGAQGSYSGVIATDKNGVTGFVSNFAVQLPSVMPAKEGSGGLGGAANLGFTAFVSSLTLPQIYLASLAPTFLSALKTISKGAGGAYGGASGSADSTSISLTVGMGAGARVGGGLTFAASAVTPICHY